MYTCNCIVAIQHKDMTLERERERKRGKEGRKERYWEGTTETGCERERKRDKGERSKGDEEKEGK